MKVLALLLAALLLAAVVVQARESIEDFEQSYDAEDMDLSADEEASQEDGVHYGFDCIKMGGVFATLRDGQNWSGVPAIIDFKRKNGKMSPDQIKAARKWYLEMKGYLVKGRFPFLTRPGPENPNRWYGYVNKIR